MPSATPLCAARRLDAACRAVAEAGLDGMLLFKQESMYWLTGYDTFGYCFFQCLVLRADGRMVLLTRAPDLRQARHTSILDDVRVWVDREDANPALDLRGLLHELGLTGKRLGVEYETHGLTDAGGKRLDAAFSCRHRSAMLVIRTKIRLPRLPGAVARRGPGACGEPPPVGAARTDARWCRAWRKMGRARRGGAGSGA